jgi:hypothetical protein
MFFTVSQYHIFCAKSEFPQMLLPFGAARTTRAAARRPSAELTEPP